LVAYAALGGVIFLFVAFLQITLGYTALQAGAATPLSANHRADADPVSAVGSDRSASARGSRWRSGPS
jgi:hypothetical protein